MGVELKPDDIGKRYADIAGNIITLIRYQGDPEMSFIGKTEHDSLRFYNSKGWINPNSGQVMGTLTKEWPSIAYFNEIKQGILDATDGKSDYEVWMGGYSATGEHSKAKFIGKVKAETFQKACDFHYIDNPAYDRDKLSVWGCRLFNNENDARKSFE